MEIKHGGNFRVTLEEAWIGFLKLDVEVNLKRVKALLKRADISGVSIDESPGRIGAWDCTISAKGHVVVFPAGAEKSAHEVYEGILAVLSE